jgi:murein L,D-transpeptidase YcbB/YkuD
MKVIVGSPDTETPMMAALMRFSSVNPYWNVPTDLTAKLIAPRVLAGGLSYLSDRGYQVLDGWTEDAGIVDPATVDWPAVASGDVELRVRQLPGGGNSMGEIKFMMPNEYGIYLHDTPGKAAFEQDERWVSNGCVRVEDAHRLANWLYGYMPKGQSADREERVDLVEPVPVYITYLTVAADEEKLSFREDRYGRDAPLMARFKGEDSRMVDPDEQFRRAMTL